MHNRITRDRSAHIHSCRRNHSCRRIAAALGVVALAMTLAACTDPATSYSDLGGTQVSEDELRADTIAFAADQDFDIDPSSSRLVAVHEDTDVFLARATQNGEDLICVLLTGPNGGAFSCSARNFSVSDSVNEYRPLSDDVADTELDPADGWIRLSENVFTRPFDNGPEDTQ
ncbi:hypothetical protein HOW07_16775 [Plantibacter sp. MCCC 1A11337]|uniref:hypothetical protein n=1 Tax=Plantibacter sp. MCCC 1A11337 TaxID=2736644 RepID=UPI00158445FE|nr:hypothetical protein [Plantibacter sp. MCCC 1A11337]NUJ89671.1 hypothetical protein [Plantibacter sp. MCCC 1A11337]